MFSRISRRMRLKLDRKLFATSVVNEPNVVRSKVPPLSIPNGELLDEYLWKNADRWADKTALVCLETGRSYTYSETRRRSKSFAHFLRKSLNLEPKDTIAFILPNIPEYSIAVLGAIEAGLRLTTINPLYTSDEIYKQLSNAETKAVVVLNGLFPTAKLAVDKLPGKVPIVVVKHLPDEDIPRGAIKFDEVCSEKCDGELDRVDSEDVVLLPYSSGTTGLPKGVMLTHKNLVTNLYQFSAPDFRLNEETTGNHQDVVPLFLPQYHCYGLVVVFFNMFALGCKLVTVPKFSSNSFMQLLKEHKPSILYAVPPVILMMLNNENFQLDNLNSLRHIITAAAPLGGADIHRFRDKTRGKIELLQVYGLTETSPIVTWSTRKIEAALKIGGSGIVVPNTECKVVDLDDPTNVGLPVGKAGELLVRGDQNMKGYFKNEEATKATLIEGGWLRTGDIAYYDEDEHFFITDRIKEMIKVKGFQVAPAELEEVLRSHPAVADAAVIGVKDETSGEAPKAFIVLKNEKTKPDDIKEFVASKVAHYKQLTGGIVVLDSIPRSPAGKLLRRTLKEL